MTAGKVGIRLLCNFLGNILKQYRLPLFEYPRVGTFFNEMMFSGICDATLRWKALIHSPAVNLLRAVGSAGASKSELMVNSNLFLVLPWIANALTFLYSVK